MTHDDPAVEMLRSFERPTPPPALEARTLAAAGLALRAAPESDLWERVWSSRPLRLLWATTLLALLAGHAAVSLREWRDGGAPPLSATRREKLPPEVATIADLPAITLSGVAWESGGERTPARAGHAVEETRQ